MGIPTSTFYDSGQRRRRRIIYVLCGLIVVGCGLAVFLLSRKERRGVEPSDRTPAGTAPVAEGPDEAGTGTGEPGVAETATSHPRGGSMPALPSKMARVAAAREQFDRAMEWVRAALTAPAGTDEAIAARREALTGLLAAQEAFEVYLEEYPEAENGLERTLVDLQSQIYGIRKSMTIKELGAFNGGSTPPDETAASLPPPAGTGSTRRPPDRTPTPSIPDPAPRAIDPEKELAKFLAGAKRAFREGRPDRVVELGDPLLQSEEMAPYIGEIPSLVDLARLMDSFLGAARKTLGSRVGSDVDLEIRKGRLTGELLAAGDEIVVRDGSGERRTRIGRLSCRQLLTLAEVGGFVWSPDLNRAVGAFFTWRGDELEGVERLLGARAEGLDVSLWAKEIERGLARSPELRAVGDWLKLLPELDSAKVEVLDRVVAFQAAHRATRTFEDNRERLFRAAAAAVAKNPFEIEDLWAVPVKISGKGLKVTWKFESPEEIRDFRVQGDWKVEAGAIAGQKGMVWTEQFAEKDLDVRFVLARASAMSAGIGNRLEWGKKGVHLSVAVVPAGLEIHLRHGNKTIGAETVKRPSGKVEVLLQKRGDRYQVKLGRKVVVKGRDLWRRHEELPVGVSFSAAGELVVLEEIEIHADLFMDWAKAGGRRFAAWIRDWYVTGPFPLEGKNLDDALGKTFWPEERGFDPGEKGEDGKPIWRHQASGDGRLDLNRSFRPNDRITGYAAVRIWSPEKRTAILDVEVDDNARVWLNGQVVLKRAPLGSPHRATVKLERGENVLLAKVVEAGGAYWLRARLLTKGGEPMRDVRCW